MNELMRKIQRKWMKLRLQPIRVFCFHHVSETFDAEIMHECDWMQIDEFKSKMQAMRKDGVEFISLTKAKEHLINDKFRKAKYAVITFDDGWASIREIIPWLCEQQIPVTLFLNPAYIKGDEKREMGTSLTQEELEELLRVGKGLITIASHGWNHTLCTELSMNEFEESVNRSEDFLSQYSEYISFFAYPCGRKLRQQDDYLLSKSMIPVYMDGERNYCNIQAIHRELLS